MEIESEAIENFRSLLKFETVNPPGNERSAILYLAKELQDVGLDPKVVEAAPDRLSLIVRYKGNGNKRPLLINSHVDVVGVEPEKWKFPPFSGTIAEGCIWGRGAIDMKNMTAYCLATLKYLARNKVKLNRDIIMTAVADEEVGGVHGMGHLVKNYSDLLKCEFAIGELGGYTLHLGGKRIYPVQVAEKGIYQIEVVFKGEPGHGSYPKQNNVHYEVGRFLDCLSKKQMPFHLTSTTEKFLDGLAKSIGGFNGLSYKLLKTPLALKILKNKQLKNPMDMDTYAAISGMLSHTVNPTGLVSGRQINVVPSTATVRLDCRVLPGFSPESVKSEIEKIWGRPIECTTLMVAPGHENSIETEAFKIMTQKILKHDPGAHVVPMMITGFTDGQYLKKLGCEYYGFTPVMLPQDLNFPKLYHGHNERIPVEGFKWGLKVFLETVLDLSR